MALTAARSRAAVTDTAGPRPHPRTIGWLGATALAVGGSNQSLFLIGALLAAQGSAAVPLLGVGLLLSWMAIPGWIELGCMFPDRVGGIAATCAEAFRPYSAVLANLTGTCYWWGWVPTCGVTAILSATAVHEWFLPGVPVTPLAVGIVLLFAVVNLCGVKWATRLAIPMAATATSLAFLAALVPVLAGTVNWRQASTFHLISPFHGFFGSLTSVMAGLYLIGFAAPAFEAAACHIGEMRRPAHDHPIAMYTAAGLAAVYFVALPVVWLGLFGPTPLEGDLASTLGPSFAPLFGTLAKSAAIWFMTLNMFHGTLQPLSGASRTLSQLAEDGLLPRSLARRAPRTDAPYVAIAVTAVASIAFLLAGDPTSLIAAANLTYLIGIALPSIAVWVLRRNEPERSRPYRPPAWMVTMGVVAAAGWLATTLLGFEQFGLRIVLLGLALAYSGSIAYVWRVYSDARRSGDRLNKRSVHLKLTGSMLAVLALDGTGYLAAVTHVKGDPSLVTALNDIFVTVGVLTISVGLVLPGMIANAVGEVSRRADRLANGTLLELTNALEALGRGDVAIPSTTIDLAPVRVVTRDEIGRLADSFNIMQGEAARVAVALDAAREQLRAYQEHLESLVARRTAELTLAYRDLAAAEQQRLELQRRTREMARRAGSQVHTDLDLAALLGETADFVGRMLDGDHVSIFLIADSDGRLGAPAAEWRRDDGQAAGQPNRPDPDLLGWFQAVADGRDAVAVPDLHAVPPPGLPAGARTTAIRMGFGALLLCPMLLGEAELVGLLVLSRCAGRADWTEDEKAIAEQVAADLVRGVTHARLYRSQQELVARLRELDQAKSEFLSTVSHELRTPLTSIRSYVELLGSDQAALSPRQGQMLRAVDANTRRLSGLVDDILTLSRADSGTLGLNIEPCDIVDIVTAAHDAVAPTAFAGQVLIDLRFGKVPDEFPADRDQLERVLLNLLTNAIKFTPPGGLVVVAARTVTGWLEISVADSGPGIPAAERDLVFQRFFRGTRAVADAIPGTGLGLAIVRTIVERHGGTVAIAQTSRKGTKFVVRLPLRLPDSLPSAGLAVPGPGTKGQP